MTLTYPVTLGDWKAAIRLHARQSIGRRIHFFIYDYVFPSLAIAGLAFLAFAKTIGDTRAVDALIVPVASLLGIAIIVPIARQYSIRKSFRGMFPRSELGSGYSLDIDENRILSMRPEIGEATYYWSGILRVAQDKDIILIYLSELLFLAIPIHILSQEQHAEISRIIASHRQTGKPC